MARVFTDGAEMDDVLFWSSAGMGVTAGAPSGDYCYYSTTVEGVTKNITAVSEGYFRVRIKWQNVWNASGVAEVVRFYNSTTLLAYVRANNASNLVVGTAGDGVLATSTETVNPDTWYLVEVYYKIDDTTGRFVVKVDGVIWIDFTGDTKGDANTTFDRLMVISTNGSSWFTTWWDDLAFNDTTGGVDDSWCGDGHIEKVYPNGNGADNDWTGSDGDSTDNYLLVDEFPNDGDTTYVTGDGTSSGLQDQYALSDYDGSGGKIISRIYPECRAKKTDTSATTLKLGILPSGGADDLSDARTLTTSYARYVGDDYLTNPADAGAWEEADIDALEGIVEIG